MIASLLGPAAIAALVPLAQVGPGAPGMPGSENGPPGLSGPSGGQAQAQTMPENTPEHTEYRASLSRRSVKLFDGNHVTQSLQVNLGPLYYRSALRGTHDEYERGTGELLVGVAITSVWGPFFLTGYEQIGLRAFDSKSFAFSFLIDQLGVGMRLGPIEPEVRVGLAILTVDSFHAHASFEAVTPRVGAAVGLHLGQIRLDIAAHSEYLWRWFGPDYQVRGVTLGLRLDFPKQKPKFTEPPRS